MFLECVCKQPQVDRNGANIEITEWKNMTWSLDEDDASNSLSSMPGRFGLLKLFDWQVQFYSHIPVTE
jgi:hypothetical protein